jgi:uncharacterized protein (DUF58 family)
MLSADVLAKVKKIELKTRGLVRNVFAGEYHSAFKGLGMEFAEVKEYTYGDDIRNIDWHVTARLDQPYVKRFEEERELTVILAVDVSGSERIGSGAIAKRDYAAELAAVLAFSANRNNDKVGLLLFSDRVEKYVPPRKGRKHILHVVREVLFFREEGKGTSISKALQSLNRGLHRRATVFLISDFIDANYQTDLRIVARKHDLIAVRISDPLEQLSLPSGWMRFSDAETGREFSVNTSSKAFQQMYRSQREKYLLAHSSAMNKAGVDWIDIFTDRDYTPAINQFFRRRSRQKQRQRN